MQPVIGLEIHVELKTRSKMFCGCENNPEELVPNKNICPICVGHPGTLPLPNKKAIEYLFMIGKALGAKINYLSKFDRKNYFYPDLPKGYQISQYDWPICEGGAIEVLGEEVKIRRIHLEEDTARMIHERGVSLVDFNRAGIPLMELVTEPVIHSSKVARAFAEELQLILRYLGVARADMEKGEMRIEANVSLRGDDFFGKKVEVKNINSFKAVEEAIDYEIKRQQEVLKEGGEVVQETRGWDEVGRRTISQRTKEEAHDYRYFKEPDIYWFRGDEVSFAFELPRERRKRFKERYGIGDERKVEFFVREKRWGDYFEKAAEKVSDFSLLANYLSVDLRAMVEDPFVVEPRNFAELINFLEEGTISSRLAKEILPKVVERNISPKELMKDEGIEEVKDESSIEEVIGEVFRENKKAIDDYRQGKKNALEYLFGQAMKKLRGQGNPSVIRKVLLKKINEIV